MNLLRCAARPAWWLAGALLLSASTFAQTVSMTGRFGNRALLMIDGVPKTLAVGDSAAGVKLVGVATDEAILDIAGRRTTVRLGGTQVSLGATVVDGGGSKIVLSAGPGGHFVTVGSINGSAVQFMVDTGASTIAMSQADAERIGLKYREGPRGMVHTANGMVAVHRVMLTSVRVGEVLVYNVEAMVVPAPMRHVLLGNSFLTRFQMRRDNDVMTLEKRP